MISKYNSGCYSESKDGKHGFSDTVKTQLWNTFAADRNSYHINKLDLKLDYGIFFEQFAEF